MNHYVEWGILAAIGLGVAYVWNKSKNDEAEKSVADLRRRRAEFFEAQKQRWALFYRMHKQKFGLTDEEIVSRYIFVAWGEISGDPWVRGPDGFFFPTTAPSRSEVLGAIGNDHVVPQSAIDAIAQRFDRDGEAAFASKYDVLQEILKACRDEDDKEKKS
jgi:hypothetical protein